MKKYFLLLITSFLFISCSKDNNPVEPPVESTKGIFIINEGIYGRNNSELSYYDFSTNIVTTNYFELANGRALGDNANSMFIFEGKGYIAVDASNKIEVIDLKNGKSLGIIDLGPQGSPREIYILNKDRGFVTSFSKNKVVEFNPTNFTITREIQVGKFPEGITSINGKLFIANSDLGKGSTVSVIDLNTNLVLKTLTVGLNPRSVTLTSDGKVVVGCSGDFFNSNSLGGFYFINSNSMEVNDSIILTKHPQDFTLTTDNYLYYINDSGVGQINLATKNVDTTFIQGKQVNDIYEIAYTIAFDEQKNILYISNPKDFTQNGEIKLFDRSGKYISKFDVKINPGGIYIYR